MQFDTEDCLEIDVAVSNIPDGSSTMSPGFCDIGVQLFTNLIKHFVGCMGLYFHSNLEHYLHDQDMLLSRLTLPLFQAHF